MSVSFIHLSDIHFGQEKGGVRVTHDDVKERLIEDARAVTRERNLEITGIILTGDVAYAGKLTEFQAAGLWLDRLADAVGCPRTAVQVVPGNHDIDRSQISEGCRMMLREIAEQGEARLDAFLSSEVDAKALYQRLDTYFSFAEGYNCLLDRSGGIASDRRYELAAGRTVRVLGLNSALLCSSNDDPGHLLLGARQRVLPMNDGEELVILCHHPLHWFQDSADARNYIRNRARVLITGHEHTPALCLENIRDGCDLMTLAAGAAVPPEATDKFIYTYNVLSFDFHEPTDSLLVDVIARSWVEEQKNFSDDPHLLHGRKSPIVLASPRFKNAPRVTLPKIELPVAERAVDLDSGLVSQDSQMAVDPIQPERFALVLLRFFRDLSAAQRVEVLVKLGALPPDWREDMSRSVERRVVDRLAREGRLPELEKAIADIRGAI